MNKTQIEQNVSAQILHLAQQSPNDAILGLAPLVLAGVFPQEIVDSPQKAITLLDSIFLDPTRRGEAMIAVSFAKNIIQSSDKFFFILNNLGQEVVLWEYALFSRDVEKRWEAQETLRNYIEMNDYFPYAGGLDPAEEEELGLLPRVRSVTRPTPKLKERKSFTRQEPAVPLELKNQDKAYFEILDPRKKEYAILGTFMGLVSLFYVNECVSNKKKG